MAVGRHTMISNTALKMRLEVITNFRASTVSQFSFDVRRATRVICPPSPAKRVPRERTETTPRLKTHAICVLRGHTKALPLPSPARRAHLVPTAQDLGLQNASCVQREHIIISNSRSRAWHAREGPLDHFLASWNVGNAGQSIGRWPQGHSPARNVLRTLGRGWTML